MKIAIIGDYDKDSVLHPATNEAIDYSRKLINVDFQADWIPTDIIEANFDDIVAVYDGFWIASGSPYKSMKGALKIIEYTRMHQIPTIGTCGGFQHMVIEFARNVLGIKDAEHAEYDPYASKLVVNPLSCNLKGKPLQVSITDVHSITFEHYQTEQATEKYYCNFGLNPDYRDLFDQNGFNIVGTDEHKEARIMELDGHPFFIATLFVPQDNCTAEQPHKLVTAFLLASQMLFQRRIAKYNEEIDAAMNRMDSGRFISQEDIEIEEN